MTRKKVSVQVEGRNYALITSDDEKYVYAVADEVVKQIRKAAESSKQLDTRDCAILAALNFCDDRNKAVKHSKDIIAKADKIIKQTNDLNKLCADYKVKLAEAINDNTRLTQKVRALENHLANLSRENDILSAKLSELTASLPEQPKKEEEKKKENSMDVEEMHQYSLFDDVDDNETQLAEDKKKTMYENNRKVIDNSKKTINIPDSVISNKKNFNIAYNKNRYGKK